MWAIVSVALLLVVGMEAHPMMGGNTMRNNMMGNQYGNQMIGWYGMSGGRQQWGGHSQQWGGHGQQGGQGQQWGGHGQQGQWGGQGQMGMGGSQQQTPIMSIMHAMMTFWSQMMMMKMGGGGQGQSHGGSSEESSEEDSGKKDLYDLVGNMVDVEELIKGAIFKELHEGMYKYSDFKKKEAEFVEAMRYLCLSVAAVEVYANQTKTDLYSTNTTKAEEEQQREEAQKKSDEELVRDMTQWIYSNKPEFESYFFKFAAWSCHAGMQYADAKTELEDKKEGKCDDRK